MYIWAQSALFEGGTPIDRLSRAEAEFIGWRARPTSPFERREERGVEMREEIAEEFGISGTYEDIKNIRGYGTGEAWADMDLTQTPEASRQQDPETQLLMSRDPEMAALNQMRREESKRRDSEWGRYYKEIDLLWDNDDEESLGVLQQLEAAWKVSQSKHSEHPGEHYRLKRSAIFARYYHDKELARRRAEKRGAIFDDKEVEGPFAGAQDVYNRLLFADDDSEEYRAWVEGLLKRSFSEYKYTPIEDDYGFNWDEREQRMEYLVRAYSQKFVDDMKALSEANPTRLLPQVELDYRRAVEFINSAGYWDADKILADQYGLSAQLKEYKRLHRIDEPRAKAYLDDRDVLRKRVINKAGDFRRLMRSTVKGLDSILLWYGYVSTRISSTAEQKYTGW